MNPLEDDFETWKVIVSSTVMDSGQFAYVVPQIVNFLDSFSSTGKLPESIADKTEDFLIWLQTEILYPLFNSSYISNLDVMTELWGKLLDAGEYGVTHQHESSTHILVAILNSQLRIYQVSDEFTYFTVCSLCHARQIFEKSIHSVQSGDIKDIGYLHTIHSITRELVREMSISEYSRIFAVACLAILRNDVRSSTQIITSLCDEILDSAQTETVSEDFAFPWLELFSFMIKTYVFEKQLAGLKEMKNILCNEVTLPSGKLWFESQKEPIFNFKTIHPELCAPCGELFAKLAEIGLLDMSVLRPIWNLHSVQHAADMAKFFGLFVMIAGALSVDILPEFIEMCLNPVEKNEEWFKFIGSVGASIGIRDGCRNAFILIRDFLYNESMNGNKSAQGQLHYVIHFDLSDQDFDKYITELSKMLEHDFAFLALIAIVGNKKCNADQIEFCLGIAFKLLKSGENVDNALTLLNRVCSSNMIKLTWEQSLVVYSCRNSCSMIHTKLHPLFYHKLIDGQALLEAISNESVDSIDYSVFTMVKYLTAGLSDRDTPVVHKLPLFGEEFLWNMALKNTAMQQQFIDLLAHLYANNDGIDLTDYSVISYFIDKWNERFQREENKNAMLSLLKSFVVEIEFFADCGFFNVTKHKESTTSTITVNVSGKFIPNLSFVLPVRTPVSVLRQKIVGEVMIRADSFIIEHHGVVLRDKMLIQDVAKREALDIQVVCATPSANTRSNIVRQRSMIPSLFFVQSNGKTFDMLLSLLRDPQICETAKEILNQLPTCPQSQLAIEMLSRKSDYDFSELLPVEFPLLFRYNFEVLVKNMTDDLDEHFEKSGGYTYLIESLGTCQSEVLNTMKFIRQNDHVMKIMNRELFETLLPVLVISAQEQNIDLFNGIVEFLAELDPVEIEAPMLEAVIESIFNDNKHSIRTKAESLFKKMNIPMESFVKLIERINEENGSEFYRVFLEHIDHSCDELVSHIKSACSSDSPRLIELYQILERMLEKSFVSEEDKLWLTRFFITRYLQIDDQIRDRDIFIHVCRCLRYLTNDVLRDHLYSLHANKGIFLDWHIDGDMRILSSTEGSGLENLGATCFLNSTLQQFFAIKPLRKRIIEYSGDNGFILELRNLFIQMTLLKGESLSTATLVSQWTGWGGEPIDPMTQQDACEFTQMLIDKLEESIGKDVVADLFTGSTVDQINGLSCDYESSREQPFTTFTLAISGCTDIYEALEKFQLPDFFTGDNQYSTQEYGKIDAKKFASFSKLPKRLIIQLARFEYNYATWTRTKINDPINVPLDLDLHNYTSSPSQESQYKLTGVIVHAGTAEFGHYMAYINSGEKWIHCNDSVITEVKIEDIQEIWRGKKTTSAYLLFYTRRDVVSEEVSEPIIDSAIVEQIQEQTREKQQHRLYCSEGYFDLMTSLAKVPDLRFSEIVMHYYFDTLPFTNFSHLADQLSVPLCEVLNRSSEFKNTLLQYVLHGKTFQCGLSNCPEIKVRDGACSMIKCIEATEIPLSILIEIFGKPASIVRFFRVFNEMFDLLASILARNPIMIISVTSPPCYWHLHLTAMIMRSFQDYTKNPNAERVNANDFWTMVDLTGLFRLIRVVGYPEVFAKHITTDEFIANVLRSKTQIESFASLIRTIPVVESIVTNFVEREGMRIDFLRTMTLLFQLFGESVFRVLNTVRLKVDNRIAGNWDIACFLCYAIQNGLRDMVRKSVGIWLLHLLTDQSHLCRMTVLHVIALLIPVEEMHSSLPVWSQTSLMDQPVVSMESKNDKITADAKEFLDLLISNRETVVEEMISSVDNREAWYSYWDYFYLTRVLAHIVGENLGEHWLLVTELLLPYAMSWDNYISIFVENLNHAKIDLEDQFVVDLFPSFEAIPANVDVTPIKNFLVNLQPFMMKIVPSDDFICKFLEFYAFTTNTKMHESYYAVAPYVQHFAKSKPDLVFNWLSQRLRVCCALSMSAVLIILEETGKKLPILNYLWDASIKVQIFAHDELIVRMCDYSTIPEDFDSSLPIHLLNSLTVGPAGRARLWKLIKQLRPPFETFEKIYNWTGENEDVVEYLVLMKDPNSKALLLKLVRNNIKCFLKAYSLLKEIAMEEIVDPIFSGLILSHDFSGNGEILTDYMKELLSRNAGIQERVVQPVISKILLRMKLFVGILRAGNPIRTEETDSLVELLRVALEFPICRDLLMPEILILKEAASSMSSEALISSLHSVL